MDIYDKEIAYLTENPDRIYHHWNHSSFLFAKVLNPAHPLLNGLTRGQCGCITQIRENNLSAETFELETEIKNDNRIPLSPDNPRDEWTDGYRELNIEDLQIFAEWQRKIDIKLNRITPIEEEINSGRSFGVFNY